MKKLGLPPREFIGVFDGEAFKRIVSQHKLGVSHHFFSNRDLLP
ncbi:Putative protein [Zobellia galactanivorans]|uniref:Uncharacterized protein n=1 Tax=Zobellia galactanivorans (strain DSM 12802 / CCUG 47099 / CIP 106680 / NCIMB 13871 / Dsij) TaxID=63186 RepID=G0L5K2_ZOBGA|nr:Putative protein [Zobellia galactanivorans]